jgi:large subunit ribosomal protein L4
MPSLPIYDINKNKVGSIDISDAVFGAELKPHLLNHAVRAQIAWRYEYRTANSKTRTEVAGTGKKMYKQKGTGQARHGDAKAPIFVGGGKAHGPKPRRVRFKINKKVMKAALIGALSQNHKEDRLFIVDKMELDKMSTKEVFKIQKTFNLKKALIVNSYADKKEANFNHSAKNIVGFKFLKPEGVNVFDVLKFENLIVSKKAVQALTERLTHV